MLLINVSLAQKSIIAMLKAVLFKWQVINTERTCDYHHAIERFKSTFLLFPLFLSGLEQINFLPFGKQKNRSMEEGKLKIYKIYSSLSLENSQC